MRSDELMPHGRPIYLCDCLAEGGKEMIEITDNNIEALARTIVETIAQMCGAAGMCSVAGTRVAARALVYANSLQMTVFSRNGEPVTQREAETQLLALVEEELARGDSHIGGIDTVYKKETVPKPARPTPTSEEA